MSDRDATSENDRRRPALVIVRVVLSVQLLIAVGAAAVWFHGRSGGAQLAPSEVVQFSAPVHGPVALETALPLAQATAKRWNPRAELLSASQELDWSPTATANSGQDQPGGGWLTYVFVAPRSQFGADDQAASLSILIDRNSGNVVSASTLSWHEMPTTSQLKLGKLPIDSTKAVTIAENAAGRSFRHDCATVRHSSWLNLIPAKVGPPVWLITYADTRNPDRNGLAVRINAQTGKIISTVNQAQACGT